MRGSMQHHASSRMHAANLRPACPRPAAACARRGDLSGLAGACERRAPLASTDPPATPRPARPQGAYASVFEAEDLGTGLSVALKVSADWWTPCTFGSSAEAADYRAQRAVRARCEDEFGVRTRGPGAGRVLSARPGRVACRALRRTPAGKRPQAGELAGGRQRGLAQPCSFLHTALTCNTPSCHMDPPRCTSGCKPSTTRSTHRRRATTASPRRTGQARPWRAGASACVSTCAWRASARASAHLTQRRGLLPVAENRPLAPASPADAGWFACPDGTGCGTAFGSWLALQLLGPSFSAADLEPPQAAAAGAAAGGPQAARLPAGLSPEAIARVAKRALKVRGSAAASRGRAWRSVP
jgi:hypothetical protein